MRTKNPILATGEYYHIYNRSIAREDIFSFQRNLTIVKELLNYYRYSQELRYSMFKRLSIELKNRYLDRMVKKMPLVEIHVYSFMPNHYHFILKQLMDGGISKFVSTFQNSFAKWFNLKYDRVGSLFQNQFKGKFISSRELFIHISRYAHLNHVTDFIIEVDQLKDYPWTSFPNYTNENNETFVTTDSILGEFKSKENYLKFVVDQADYQRRLALIKHLMID